MNPNYTCDPETREPIPLSASMDSHAMNVWGKYVKNAGFRQIHIIAHSAGGFCLS